MVDRFVQASKADGGEYGDSYAIGAMRAVLTDAVAIMDDIIETCGHEDPAKVVSEMRYPVIRCKSFIKFIKDV